jgi:hypothetical protein
LLNFGFWFSNSVEFWFALKSSKTKPALKF